MLTYLAGPINGCSDSEATHWRDEARRLLHGLVVDPMVRDYRGAEHGHAAQIVEADKADIDRCGAVLAYCPKPSVGTSMEILYAWSACLYVVTVVPDGVTVSPWLTYHSAEIVTSVRAASSLLVAH